MNFTKFQNLKTNGHQDISFIDINLETDIALFIDPTLIEYSNDTWCIEAQKVIRNFFSNLVKAYNNKNKNLLKYLIQHANEPNETKLGYSQFQSRGNGTSADRLYDILNDYFRKTENLNISSLKECTVFIEKFAEDRMSDLLTQILRKKLYEFTILQYQKYNIPLSKNTVFLGSFWDNDAEKWDDLYGYAPLAKGKKVLLVPKTIVRNRYVLNVEGFINSYIIPIRQKYHYDNRTSLVTETLDKHNIVVLKQPSKKLVYSSEVKDTIHKQYASAYLENEPQIFKNYTKSINYSLSNNKFTIADEELDSIVYNRRSCKTS